MREESHLDRMRDAIRGDDERLAENAALDVAAESTEHSAGVAPDPEEEPEAEEPEPDDESERRSWLARLFST